MIYLCLNFSWPFKDNNQVDYLLKEWKVSENKNFSVQFSKCAFSVFGFSLNLSHKQSHAGLMLDITLFRHMLILEFSDRRHWNRKENRWYRDDEEQ